MNPILSLKNVTYSIPYGKTIFENVFLEARQGELIGLLGHNGMGKSTIIDIILGNKQVLTGSVDVLNENPHDIDRKNKHEIAYLSQDVIIKGDLSIHDFLKFHSSFYPKYSEKEQDRLLQIFNLSLEVKVGSLSTGQQKKVQIVAGFSTCPKLLLIDEITAVLDPETREIFFKELIRMKTLHQSCILIATNIAEDLEDVADRILFISNGTAKEHSSNEILSLFK